MLLQAWTLGLLLAAGQHSGEIYFEQTTLTTVDGRAAGAGVVSRVWHAGKTMRLEAGEALESPAFILRLDSGTAYRLDPQAKTAVRLDAERLRARSQMDLAMAGDLMGGGEEGAARTVPLKTARTIAGYPCRGYRIRAGDTVMDVYLTEALPLGIADFAEFLEWSGAGQALGGIMDELMRLRGFPLETRTRVGVLGKVVETLSTVTKVRLDPLPAGLFEPPPGYRVVDEAQEPR